MSRVNAVWSVERALTGRQSKNMRHQQPSNFAQTLSAA